jgi:N-acetylneuraminic acid mutarotase
MLYKLIFIVLNQLFLLLLKDVHGQAFVPEPRVGQVAALVENKIYFIGGLNSALKTMNDIFYYDFESGLNSSGWANVQSQEMNLPTIRWLAAHTGAFYKSDRDSIFIIGGVDETLNLVYRLDTETNTLRASTIQGKFPPRRMEVSTVSHVGFVYIFSGGMENNGITTLFNNFDILDTNSLIWKVGSLINAPPPKLFYTATLVNNDVIYYIGGLEQNGLIQVYSSMTNVCKLDI